MIKHIIKICALTLIVIFVFTGCKNEAFNINGSTLKEDLKIGAILPLTGDAASYGQSAKQAIDLALEKLNQQGGIFGQQAKVIYEDDQALPEKGVTAVQKLINQDKVPVIIGAMPSSVTLAIAPIAEENKVVLLSPCSSNPEITRAGDYVFRNDVSDYFDGKVIAEHAYNKMNIRRVATMVINNDYGLGIKKVFITNFKELGGQVVAEEIYNQGEVDFKKQIIKTKEARLSFPPLSRQLFHSFKIDKFRPLKLKF